MLLSCHYYTYILICWIVSSCACKSFACWRWQCCCFAIRIHNLYDFPFPNKWHAKYWQCSAKDLPNEMGTNPKNALKSNNIIWKLRKMFHFGMIIQFITQWEQKTRNKQAVLYLKWWVSLIWIGSYFFCSSLFFDRTKVLLLLLLLRPIWSFCSLYSFNLIYCSNRTVYQI